MLWWSRKSALWFLKITDYADALLDDLTLLEGWPERVRPCRRTGSPFRGGNRFSGGGPRRPLSPCSPPGLTPFGVAMWFCPRTSLVDVITASEHRNAVEAFRDW